MVTVMAEIENVINNSSLTHVCVSHNHPEALTLMRKVFYWVLSHHYLFLESLLTEKEKP